MHGNLSVTEGVACPDDANLLAANFDKLQTC